MSHNEEKEPISFDEIKDAFDLIMRDEKARKEFINGVKEVMSAEKKILLMMPAGLLMILFGVFGFLGLLIFLGGLVMFGVKVARFTLGQNESFMDLLFDYDEED